MAAPNVPVRGTRVSGDNTVVPTGAGTQLDLTDFSELDELGIADFASDKLVIAESGLYLVTGSVAVLGVAGGTFRRADLTSNIQTIDLQAPLANGQYLMPAPHVVRLGPGDEVVITGEHDAGVDVAFTVATLSAVRLA